MPLKHYIPISIGVFVLVLLTAHHYSVPIAPFALVLLVGETMIGLQLEDQRVSRFLEDLMQAFKSNPKSH